MSARRIARCDGLECRSLGQRSVATLRHRFTSPIQQKLGHVVQLRLSRFPVWQQGFEQAVEVRAVVVLFQVAQFVDYDVLDACTGSLDQLWVEQEFPFGRTATPLRTHVQ